MTDFTANFTLEEIQEIEATFSIIAEPTKLSQLEDDSTHRLVTDTEKSTWNGKQDAFSYTPEDVANKETSTIDTSTTKYPCNNVIKTALETKPTISSGSGAPSSTPSKIGDIYVDTTNKKMYISNGTSSSADWVKQSGSYSLPVFCAKSDPADATTYFFGCSPFTILSVYYDASKIYIPRKGTISKVYLTFTPQNILGSNEAVSLYIRVNNTTDYLVSNNIVLNTFNIWINNTSLSIPVNAGDYINYKLVTPTWATNPAQLYINGNTLIDL